MSGLGLQHHGEWLKLSSAADIETNLVLYLQHERAAADFQNHLWNQRTQLALLVRNALHLRPEDYCEICSRQSWIQGGFNVCVMVAVKSSGRSTTYVLRCPFPHRVAESQYPGTMDEKLRCEVATYIWIEEHCRDIPIPKLHAFGFTDGRQFTQHDQASLLARFCRYIRRQVHRLFGLSLLSNYHPSSCPPTSKVGHMLLEYIRPDVGQMLSTTWESFKDKPQRSRRLFKAISRLILSLARAPQARIGSWRFNPDDCTISLTNRPLMVSTMTFEHSGTPRVIQQDQTYCCTDSFVADTLTLYDEYMRHNPHAVADEEDAYERMAMRTLLRACSHHFLMRELRQGPFILQFTDLHQSNIFVDSDWNITCLVDLEWICALPTEMLSVPYWLTGCSIDEIVGEQYELYDATRQTFLSIMDEERTAKQKELTLILRNLWESKGVWFWASLKSLNAWHFLFQDHILPKFFANNQAIALLRKPQTSGKRMLKRWRSRRPSTR
ncbi:hypothetical protein BN1708_008672 [Verticillium longisporum]|uniref:Aminoglycoside phosphotransferase domain-containing protein n=1 Tax=Verticillium longisporum TaxID=100787 RepID=A0A0G4N669_VERLO|nr:hypothetical protein BN1708_008672 [Verticillium longisporum]